MKNIGDVKVQDAFSYLLGLFNKTTKKQRIFFCIIVVLSLTAYFVGKNLLEKHIALKQAQSIVNKISNAQQSMFEKYEKYRNNIFADKALASSIGITLSKISTNSSQTSGKRDKIKPNQNNEIDYSAGQSGNFYIENDAENGCVVLRYKKNTPKRTIYYASFDEKKVYCQGHNCIENTENNTVNLCYANGTCFKQKQTLITERACGDGNGTQTRECVPSCEQGSCKDWGKCVCRRGFEWDGKTCKQSQTEKDCTSDQCFNGIYCEDKESLTKNIPNGSCTRRSSCQKNKGWLYSSWKCSCNKNFCSLKEECISYPGNQDKLTLSNNGDVCFDVSYKCQEGKGWQAKAKNCECNTPGTFWNIQEKNAVCSSCTKKPINAIFTSPGQNQDNCTWECKEGYENRHNDCLGPDGQYLCAQTELSICTDEFSKKRKMEKDATTTNEGQPCYVEDKDNILFYNKKEAFCKICQCVINYKNEQE